MTLANMKEIAKANGGMIPAGIAMNMTDFEISKAIKAGYLKEAPQKMDASKAKKTPAKPAAKAEKPKPAKKETPAKESPAMNPPAVEFSKEQKDKYSLLDGIIYERMQDMHKSSFEIAHALHDIYQNNYYKIDGYKNVYDYARERYGISRGTTNNFINIIDRFAVLDNPAVFEIKPDYSGYSFTQLICMLGHTDEELKEKGINASMSSREIKKKLKSGVPSFGEAVNTLNGGKSDIDGNSDIDKEEDSSGGELNEVKANIVFELTKESFSGFPDFGSADTDTCVMEVLAGKAKVIAKLLLLGHRIQVLDIL